jgi:hypothetical protein
MFQENWKWCNQCQGLFFGGNNTLGSCPATNGHHNDTGSGNYTLSLATSGGGQSDWKWCNQCEGLFFAGNNTLGVCPATNGQHNDTNSGDYTLATSGTGQSDWKWCNQCQGLFYSGGGTRGVCPATHGPHNDTNSGDYVMFQLSGNTNYILYSDCKPLRDISVTIDVTQDMVVESVSGGPTKGFAFQLNAWSAMGNTTAWQQYCLILWDTAQFGWRWCNKCQGLFFTGENTLGVCPRGGAHDDTGSGDYALGGGDDDLAASSGGQSNWRWCGQCQGLFFEGPGRTNLGVCPVSAPSDFVGRPHFPGAGSGDYLLATSGGGQSGWRWCNQCQGLFFAGNNTLGWCPAPIIAPPQLGVPPEVGRGPHNDTGSGNYTLTTSSNGQITGMIDNWPVSGPNTVNDIFSVASLPSHTVPAGYQLSIRLENDAAGNITGVEFSVLDGSRNTVGKVARNLLSIPGVTSTDLAPISAFQLNLVGPINGESAALSSGAGRITYSATTELTALTQVPACAESPGAFTQENANSFYWLLPDTPSNTLAQGFKVST